MGRSRREDPPTERQATKLCLESFAQPRHRALIRGPRMRSYACRDPLAICNVQCLCQLTPVMFEDARLPRR
jgi:hypothetical protein